MTFSPLDYSPLAWFDASDAASITHISNGVSQWNDKSGNGNHVTQGNAASRPLTNTRTVNSLNALYFDGADMLNCPSSLYNALGAGDDTYLVVYASDIANVNSFLITGATSVNNSALGLHHRNTVVRGVHNEVANATDVTRTSDTNTHFIAIKRSGTNLTVYYDGLLTSEAEATDLVLTLMRFGRHQTGTNSLTGVICEIIIYPSALTTLQLHTTMGYLAAKWALPLGAATVEGIAQMSASPSLSWNAQGVSALAAGPGLSWAAQGNSIASAAPGLNWQALGGSLVSAAGSFLSSLSAIPTKLFRVPQSARFYRPAKPSLICKNFKVTGVP